MERKKPNNKHAEFPTFGVDEVDLITTLKQGTMAAITQEGLHFYNPYSYRPIKKVNIPNANITRHMVKLF